MPVTRRRALTTIGAALLLAGCGGDGGTATTTTSTASTETTFPTADITVDAGTYTTGESFTKTFDLSRGNDFKATKTLLLDLGSATTLAYTATVTASGEAETPIDFEVLPNKPGNLSSYLNKDGYEYVPEASATGVMQASVSHRLPAGEYVFVADNSRRGSSSPGPRVPADSVTATVEFDLTR
ncbi:MAG: hypothetical protein ABEJ57_09535 [Halobacteriaceae archaeon]